MFFNFILDNLSYFCVKKTRKYILILNISSKNIPKPHNFVNCTLQCGLDLPSIVSELNILIPQFGDFVNQFNNLVIQTNINVITDSAGNMEIDVPQNISDDEANIHSKRFNILDRLITNHSNNINGLLQKGIELENDIKSNNSEYVSVLTKKIEEFEKLNNSYKHK
jgi:hypothetical protein